MEIQNLRGIECLEVNDDFLCVQAPIALVSQAFEQIHPIARCEYDIYGHEVDLSQEGFLIFQFREHSWTLIHELYFSRYYSISLEDAQELSRRLETQTVWYAISDTAEYLSYDFYAHGDRMERLEHDQSNIQFESQFRPIQAQDVRDPYRFADDLFRKQNLYIPALFWNHLRCGQNTSVTLQGFIPDFLEAVTFDRSDFEQVDYFSLKTIETDEDNS